MKNFALITSALIAVSFSNNPAASQLPKAAKAVYDASVQVSQEEFNNLTNAYSPFDEKSTKGGAFDKNDLQKLLHDMGSENYVKLRFAIDETGYISLMMKGAHRFPLDDIEYRRNTGSAESFCPNMCSMSANANHVSNSFHHAVWENLSAAFAVKYAGKCQGGKIHRDALNEVVNSCSAEQTAVHFRFCNDGGNVSVIFVGGDNGSGKVMYRNTSYCPTMCD